MPLSLILGALVTVLFKWIKQPVVLGYIVAGFLQARISSICLLLTTEANIDFWAQIGIVVLLFSLGLEFSFKKLLNSGGSAIYVFDKKSFGRHYRNLQCTTEAGQKNIFIKYNQILRLTVSL